METQKNGNGKHNQFVGYAPVQPNLLDPKAGAMVFDELSGRLVSVPLAAFAAAVATLILRGEKAAEVVTPVLDETPAAPPQTARTARNVKTRVKAARMKSPLPEPGTKLQHAQRGEVLAEATYRGEGKFVYNRKTYPSISAAANAAAESLGHKSRSLNGWVFWGLKKR